MLSPTFLDLEFKSTLVPDFFWFASMDFENGYTLEVYAGEGFHSDPHTFLDDPLQYYAYQISIKERITREECGEHFLLPSHPSKYYLNKDEISDVMTRIHDNHTF